MVIKMKLNNKGWGMMTFIIIIGLLLFVLLFIALLVNDFDDGLPSASKRNINLVENKNLGIHDVNPTLETSNKKPVD